LSFYVLEIMSPWRVSRYMLATCPLAVFLSKFFSFSLHLIFLHPHLWSASNLPRAHLPGDELAGSGELAGRGGLQGGGRRRRASRRWAAHVLAGGRRVGLQGGGQ
jgi:hypothetical protein